MIVLNPSIDYPLDTLGYESIPLWPNLREAGPRLRLNQIIHVFCKSCEPQIVFVLTCTLAKQFYVRKSYKTHESTLKCFGNFDENIDLSGIHLAVTVPNYQNLHLI